MNLETIELYFEEYKVGSKLQEIDFLKNNQPEIYSFYVEVTNSLRRNVGTKFFAAMVEDYDFGTAFAHYLVRREVENTSRGAEKVDKTVMEAFKRRATSVMKSNPDLDDLGKAYLLEFNKVEPAAEQFINNLQTRAKPKLITPLLYISMGNVIFPMAMQSGRAYDLFTGGT